MSGDICDWLAKEEADAEQWGGLGGAQFYREQFAAARAEIERLRAALEVIGTDALADLMDAAADEHGRLLTDLAAERAEVERLRAQVETLRTMIDHPEVLAMLAGPGGSTCTKVIGDNESEWFRRHWRNALDQWVWWKRRYEAATGDTRQRSQIEMEARRER